MLNETVKIRTSWGIDASMDVVSGIKSLRRKGMKLGFVFSEQDMPLIVSKITSVNGDSKTRYLSIGFPFYVGKQEVEKYAGFLVTEDFQPKTFDRCLRNLIVHNSGHE